MKLAIGAGMFLAFLAWGSDLTDEIARDLLSQDRVVTQDKYGSLSRPAPAWKRFDALSEKEKVAVLSTAVEALSTGRVGQFPIDKDKGLLRLAGEYWILNAYAGKIDPSLKNFMQWGDPAESRGNAFGLVAALGSLGFLEDALDRYVGKLDPQKDAAEINYALVTVATRNDPGTSELLYRRARTLPAAHAAPYWQMLLNGDHAKRLTTKDLLTALRTYKKDDPRREKTLRLLSAQGRDEALNPVLEYCREVIRDVSTDRGEKGMLLGCVEALRRWNAKEETLLTPLLKLINDPEFAREKPELLRALYYASGPKALPHLEKAADEGDDSLFWSLAHVFRDANHKVPQMAERFRRLLKKPNEAGAEDDVDVFGAVVGPPARTDLEDLLLKRTRTHGSGRLAIRLATLGESPKAAAHWLKVISEAKPDASELREGAEGLVGMLGPKKLADIEALLTAPQQKDKVVEGLLLGLGQMVEVDDHIFARYLPAASATWAGGTTRLLSLLEIRRASVPPVGLAAWDKKINDLLAKRYDVRPVGPNEVCERVCALARDADRWVARSGNYSDVLGGMYLESSWRYAMFNLFGLFLAEAAPYCPKEKLTTTDIIGRWEEKKGWSPRLWDYFRSASKVGLLSEEKSLPYRQENRLYQEQMTETLKALEADLNPEAKKRLHEFSKNLGKDAPKDSANPAGRYGKVFQILWINRIKETPGLSKEQQQLLDSSLAALQKSLVKDLHLGETGRRKGESRWGSGLNLFAYTYGLFALDEKKDLMEPLRAVEKALKPGSVVPYDPRVDSIPLRVSSASRADVGRAFGFYETLSAVSEGKERESLKTRRDEALQRFHQYAALLVAHSEGNETHKPSDLLAPYYFHPAVGIYTALLKHQRDTEKLEPAQVTDLNNRMNYIAGLLVKLTEGKEGKPLAMGDKTYPDSANYTAPLMGLALIPLIDKCDGKEVPPSYGVLRKHFADKAAPKLSKPSAPATPGHNGV